VGHDTAIEANHSAKNCFQAARRGIKCPGAEKEYKNLFGERGLKEYKPPLCISTLAPALSNRRAKSLGHSGLTIVSLYPRMCKEGALIFAGSGKRGDGTMKPEIKTTNSLQVWNCQKWKLVSKMSC
jgi:hypothetical protein